MPNRIIRESIWTSPNFNDLSAEAERHFYRTLLLADDFGCYESSPQAVKGRCYPLKESISPRDIALWQQELTDNDLILTWDSNHRKYSVFIRFPSHNYLRSLHRRKTPPPPDNIISQLLQAEPRWTSTLDTPNKHPNYTADMFIFDANYMADHEEEVAGDALFCQFFKNKYGKNGTDYLIRFNRTAGFLNGPAADWEEEREDLAEVVLSSFTPNPGGLPQSDLASLNGDVPYIDPVKVRARLK